MRVVLEQSTAEPRVARTPPASFSGLVAILVVILPTVGSKPLPVTV